MVMLKIRYGLRILKPRLWLRVIKSNIKFLFRRGHLRYANIGYDYRCNFKCQHCFADNFRKGHRHLMTVEEHKRFAEQAMKLGVWDFAFQGGEPFLPENFMFLKEIIPVYQPDRNLVSVVTNGMFVSKEKLLELKELGVDILTVSIDSGIEEEHDKFRGVEGSWKRATDAVALALEVGMNSIVNTTISHQNIRSDGIKKIIEFSERKSVLLNATLAVPIGRWKEAREVTLTKEDWKYFKKLQSEHSLFKRDLGFSFAKNGCGAVKEMIYLTAYGDVCPCPFIHIQLGNVTEKPLREILSRALETKVFSEYPPKCLIAEDYRFLDGYLNLTDKSENMPLPLTEARNLLGSKWDHVWSKVEKPTFVGKASMNFAFKILHGFLLNVSRKSSVLDIGCGCGSSLDFFKKSGFFNAIGIDNSLVAVERCRRKGFTVFEMDASNMPEDWTNKFDVVFAHGLLEHFSDYIAFVEEMVRVSKRYIILVQPNVHSVYGKFITRLTNMFERGISEYPYKIEEFIESFDKYGFKLSRRKATLLREFEVLMFENDSIS